MWCNRTHFPAGSTAAGRCRQFEPAAHTPRTLSTLFWIHWSSFCHHLPGINADAQDNSVVPPIVEENYFPLPSLPTPPPPPETNSTRTLPNPQPRGFHFRSGNSTCHTKFTTIFKVRGKKCQCKNTHWRSTSKFLFEAASTGPNDCVDNLMFVFPHVPHDTHQFPQRRPHKTCCREVTTVAKTSKEHDCW